jgi:hypothetical protein
MVVIPILSSYFFIAVIEALNRSPLFNRVLTMLYLPELAPLTPFKVERVYQ